MGHSNIKHGSPQVYIVSIRVNEKLMVQKKKEKEKHSKIENKYISFENI